MHKEIIKAVIALMVFMTAVFYPENTEWTIPAIGLVVGYYFGRGNKTLEVIKK